MKLGAHDATSAAESAELAHLSDLDRFIVTRYDPLLQIVKQLAGRVHEVEAAVPRLDTLVAKVEDTPKVDRLEVAVGQLRTACAQRTCELALLKEEHAARLGRLEDALWHFPASFDAHQDEGAWAQIESRVAKLETAMNTGIECAHLGDELPNPEIQLLCEVKSDVASTPPSPRPTCQRSFGAKLAQKTGALNSIRDRVQDLTYATRLYKAPISTPTTDVKDALGFSEVDACTAELDAAAWVSEAHMWCDVVSVLTKVKAESPATSPGAADMAVPSFSGGGISVDVDDDCKHAASEVLAWACTAKVLVIIRNVPGVDQVPRSSNISLSGVGEDRSSFCLRCVAQLVAEVQRQSEHVVKVRPVQELGRLTIVLVGNGIGNSLRAGQEQFSIEPLL